MTDEEQIREMQAIWAERRSDLDIEGLSDMFCEDGRFINPRGGEFVGRAAIRTYFTERYSARTDWYVTHVFGPVIVRVNGDTAESTADYLACERKGAEGAWKLGASGRMHARLVRRAGGWLYAEYRIVNPPTPLPKLYGASA